MDTTGILPFSLSNLKIFFVSALFVWLFTFGSRAIAGRLGIVAKRNSRRRHERDTPLLGGLAFYLVMGGVTLFRLLFKDFIGGPEVHFDFELAFLVALTLIFAVGIMDDWMELKALPKFSAQIVAAGLVLYFHPSKPTLFVQVGVPQFLMLPLGVFCIVGLINAMNMIDGLDGLCAGITAVSSIAFAFILSIDYIENKHQLLILMALGGGCIGFLFHNFYPAKIFLGDSGSLLLGFVLGFSALFVPVHQPALVSSTVPLFVLGLPLFDVLFSILRRFRLSRSVFKGDRSHIHHRLQQVGMSHRSVVLLLLICSAYLGVSGYFLAKVSINETFFVYVSVVPSLVFWFISLYFMERRLSYQTAKFGHLFLKHEDLKLRDRNRLLKFVHTQLRDYHQYGKPFTVVAIDCADFIKELAHEKPHRMVAFYMNIYSILKMRLRESDLIGRVSEHRFAALLVGANSSDGADLAVINYLNTKIKDLQESYQVFQSHPHRPEGFRVYQFPIEASRVWQVLGINESELENSNNIPLQKAS